MKKNILLNILAIITVIAIFYVIIYSSVSNTVKDNLETNESAFSAKSGYWDGDSRGDWYVFSDGSYAKSEYINGYWLDSAGWYDSAWDAYWDHNDTGWWYQSTKSKWHAKNTWLKIDGSWYYFKDSGYMAANEWVGNYYLTGSGAMATNTWIGQYYVGADGAWIPNYTDKTTEQKTTEQKTTEQKTTEQKTTEQKTTETKPAEKVTTYTVFDPHFYCDFQSETIAKTATGGDDYSKGWINHNYIICDTCKTKYTSYSEYRQKDTCNIVTFTNKDKEYISKSLADEYYNGVKEMSAYAYYFDFCPKYMGYVEYQYKAQVVCQCAAQFDSYNQWKEHTKTNNHVSWSILDSTWGISDQCLTYEKTHYPELISTETK